MYSYIIELFFLHLYHQNYFKKYFVSSIKRGFKYNITNNQKKINILMTYSSLRVEKENMDAFHFF